MKLRQKLLLPAVLTALVATAGGVTTAVVVQRTALDSGVAAAQSMDQLAAVAAARERLGLLHAGVFRTLVLIGSLDETAVKAAREGLPRDIHAISDVIGALAQRHPRAAGAAATAIQALADYAKEADQAIDLASVDPNTGVAAMQSAEARFKVAGESMALLVADIRDAEQIARSERTAASWRTTLGLGLLSMLLTAAVVLVSARVLRRLAAALEQASGLAEAVAGGDLSRQVAVSRDDEIGQLQGSLARMVDQLRSSLHAVREAANGTAVTSDEIATGNQDLSDRTEQTAARLQQAASSMTGLSNAVGLTAEAALQANALAGATSGTAERSGAMVNQIVANMGEISQASQRIADIIGVIDGIAFQTNLLALNAAVEAARAGEQGRGFAVVAGEVRGLAQRSAGAAREIKTLIDTSVEKVEHGTRLVRDAGGTMGELVVSVRRVNEIIGEISDRANDQRHGIAQVHEAVDELDRMTQQNAALVEQSAAAATAMRQQAQSLATVVAKFRLDSHAATA
jgi:methyl-accepting chemotaxis protein